MSLFKQKILKLTLNHFFFKFILVLILLTALSPAKAYSKNKDFQEKGDKAIQKVNQVESKGKSILQTAKSLGLHGTGFNHIITIFDGLKTYINKFENSWVTLKGLDKIISSSEGVLNIPDPLEAGDKIIKQVLGSTNNNSVRVDSNTKGINASKEFHRVYTYGQSKSVLGKEGQEIQLQESKETQLAVEESSTAAENAQADVVTQDILKKIALQNSQAQIINKANQSEEQKQTRALAAADINLADISENLDQQAKRKQLQRENNRTDILRNASFNDGFWEQKK
ncbi:hypothetical protein [Mastigocoleus sp. MO_188.B34]|uniref:hypothetical protein n=1 Tax=Mastigocoleus sp. MO_188.B34 TaxID=3036635 RepID=UPI00262652BD|nr:hypothetical protein [Mastigocoleus sp. MO_188.B34]MDJ0696935.1 hypothetical protein [Mastigocoleus sp. MO_188.B34]